MLKKSNKKQCLKAQIIAQHSAVKYEEEEERGANKLVKGAGIQKEQPTELGKTDPLVKTMKRFKKFEDIKFLKIELIKAF